MAGSRQPIDLVVAKGKKHLTKKEIADRKAKELKVEGFSDVKPPDYLPKKLQSEFNEIAEKLLTIGIMTELDEDCLARYLLAKQSYLVYTNLLMKAIKSGDVDEMTKLNKLQDKAFGQCRASASDLGLTIASRCKLVVPEVKTEVKNNKFEKFVK